MEIQMKVGAPLFSYVSSFLSLPVLRATFLQLAKKTEKRKEVVAGSHSTRPVGSTRTAFPLSQFEVVTLIGVFGLFALTLYVVYVTMPVLDREVLKIPKDIADLRVMKEHISVYTKDYTVQVLIGYISVYIFMQTFMIPGTIFFSLLAGGLFGLYRGLLLVIFSATAGASSCYFLSKLFGTPIALWLWPSQIRFFRAEVAKRKEKLLNYMLFLRVTPTLPNTFINFASPIVDVPYHTFFFATVLGLIPASTLSVRAGLTLGQLKSVGDLYDAQTVSALFILGLLFILPTILTRHVDRRA